MSNSEFVAWMRLTLALPDLRWRDVRRLRDIENRRRIRRIMGF